jgi:hypothetical protein
MTARPSASQDRSSPSSPPSPPSSAGASGSLGAPSPNASSAGPVSSAPSAPVIGLRALNRAYLARQLLLQRHATSALDAVGHLVGLQAQAPSPPYYGLWSRLADFRPGELSGLLSDRRAVRVTLMRGTVHLVGARDFRELRPSVQPALERFVQTAHGKDLHGVDRAELVAEARGALAEGAITAAELGVRLHARWPERPAAALGNAAVPARRPACSPSFCPPSPLARCPHAQPPARPPVPTRPVVRSWSLPPPGAVGPAARAVRPVRRGRPAPCRPPFGGASRGRPRSGPVV